MKLQRMCRYQVVVWILQYLKYSFAKEVFILLHHTYILSGFADSNWETYQSARNFINGLVVFLGSYHISRKSKK